MAERDREHVETPRIPPTRSSTRQSVATTPLTSQQRVNEHGQVVEDVVETIEAPPSDNSAASLQAVQKALTDLRAIYEDVRPVDNSDALADFLFKLQQAELSLMDLERYTQAQVDAGQESSHASTQR